MACGMEVSIKLTVDGPSCAEANDNQWFVKRLRAGGDLKPKVEFRDHQHYELSDFDSFRKGF